MAKFDVYQEITNQIIDAMEGGTPPWRKPWTGDSSGFVFPKRANGEGYKGINVLMLWMMAEKRGYTSENWFTYRQAKEAGGQVCKGEKSTTIIYYNTVKAENEQGEEKTIPFAKAYRVFNAEQIEGLADEFYQKPAEPRDLGTKADPELEAFFASIGAKIVTSDKPQAYFSPSEDIIHMPPIETFHSANGYYSTLAHESIHFSGVEKRLGRYGKYSNKQEYAAEEIVAEIGSTMLCAQLGLTPEFDQSAAYIEGWLKALKDDKRFIFKAASAAQKATDYLLEAANPAQIKEAA
ncbi:MAG: DUF1738 domain-containing protein [Rhodobacteraceae bacterium]|nr:DUF1738 domain-containing protein [Paracoccaceae bacterium]